MNFNKDEIKNSLSIEQVESLIAELGGDPRRQGDLLVCRTICHGGESHKLYYYNNTKLFRCYTECNDTFDLFELIIKIKKQNHENWTLYNAVIYVINYFSLDFDYAFPNKKDDLLDWTLFSKWEKNNNQEEQKIVKLKIYDNTILKNFPRPRILPWEREGILKQVCDDYGICYDPSSGGIIIPHFNINNELVGIRERTLIKENEIYGKYRPAVLNGIMYNHPLGFNLYNLNNSKKAISNIKKAIVFEGEKSTLHFASMVGEENDISVACCGSNLINYQFNLLKSLNVEEIIIAFDRQYKEIGDIEWKGWTKKLKNLHDKYGKYVQISYMFDKEHLLDYKDSPIDKGKDIFFELFNKRIVL